MSHSKTGTCRPRVLQVVLSLHPGGTERLLIELVTRLNAEIPMAVCCLDERGAWAIDVERADIRVTALGRTPGFHPTLGRAIARDARQHRATVIHAHHYSPFVYSALSRLWGSKCPVIFTEHGRLSDAGPSPKRRWANQVFSHVPGRAFAVSEDVRAHLLGEGFPSGRVGVIYNGISVGSLPDAGSRAAARTRLGIDDDVVVVGTIGRLDPVKDFRTLLAAMGAVRTERPSALVIVGDGPERAALERAARELGILDTVRFLGHRDDARAWLAACDVYANSSISEGVSLTILEAMAAGLPIVATRVGGTPEIVDSSCGRLVPARDPSALAAALSDLAGRPALRRELGQTARLRAETRFTIERMVNEYAEVYRGINEIGP